MDKIESKTRRARSSRWLMLILGLATIGLAAMVCFALLNTTIPLTPDEQALVGRWVSDDADYEKEFRFKVDRTCDTDSGVEGNPPYRWKLDGPFLVVKQSGGEWERIGPIELEGDQLRLFPKGNMLRRVDEGEADDDE